MSWFTCRRNPINKKCLQKICFISLSALDLLANIRGWKNPAEHLLSNAVIPTLTDAAITLLDKWDVSPTLEQQYFTAVEHSLARVELCYLNQHGMRKLIHELAENVDTMDTFDSNLKDVIHKAETYREQYLTCIDVADIVRHFEDAFSQEVAKHQELNNYYTYKNSQDTVSILKQVHIIANANGRILDNIYEYVSDMHEDITHIKAGVQEIKSDMDHLKELAYKLWDILLVSSEIFLHSMVIFFAFTFVTAIFHIPIAEDMTVYIVVLLSEVLIRSLIVRLKKIRNLWSVILTQALFITASTLLITENSGQYILICSLIGVAIKYGLIYFQARNSKN